MVTTLKIFIVLHAICVTAYIWVSIAERRDYWKRKRQDRRPWSQR
jgi:hypothetical protein